MFLMQNLMDISKMYDSSKVNERIKSYSTFKIQNVVISSFVTSMVNNFFKFNYFELIS